MSSSLQPWIQRCPAGVIMVIIRNSFHWIPKCTSQIQIIIQVMTVWMSMFTTVALPLRKARGNHRGCAVCVLHQIAAGSCVLTLMSARIITGSMVSILKKQTKMRVGQTTTQKFNCEFHLKDIHKLFHQMWYAVQLPKLHYRNLWAGVTARVWGKLQHYVLKGKVDFIEQLYSGSSTLSDGAANQKQSVRGGISVTVFFKGKHTSTFAKT